MKRKLAMCTVVAFFLLPLTQPAMADGSSFDCKSVTDSSPDSVTPQPEQIPGANSFVYREINDSQLRLYVFSPPYHDSSKKAAVIVFFFGGGWVFGTVNQFVPQAQYLAQRGMVAMVADYRVKCRHGTNQQDAMDDARTAVRWIRTHASTLGIDPDRIVASGGSAGGHLAVSTALFDGSEANEDGSISSRPNALVLFNPWLGERTAGAEPYLPKSPQGIAPIGHIRTHAPPTLILQGRADYHYAVFDRTQLLRESPIDGRRMRSRWLRWRRARLLQCTERRTAAERRQSTEADH